MFESVVTNEGTEVCFCPLTYNGFDGFRDSLLLLLLLQWGL